MATKKIQKQFTYEQVLEAHNKLSDLPAKEKSKYARTVAFMAKNAINANPTQKELEFYMNIFKQYGDFKNLSLATKKLYELKGFTEFKKLKAKSGDVNIESGLLALGDPELGYDEDYDAEKVKTAEEQGRFITISTGGDGSFDVIVRLIDSPVPIVSDKEFKFIEDSSETKTINVTSGKVVCGDFWSIKKHEPEEWRCVELTLENGKYKAALFHKVMGGLFFGYIAVLTKLE